MRTHRSILILLASIAICLAEHFAAVRAEDELDEKALESHDPTRVFALQDERRNPFTLSQWDIGTKHYFLLKDNATHATITKVVADADAVTRLAVFKDEEYKVMVRAAFTTKDGSTVPAVYETRVRKVCITPESREYRRGTETALTFSAVNGEIKIGDAKYTIAIQRGGGALNNLMDADPKAEFTLETVIKDAPDDVFNLTDSTGHNLTLYLWMEDAKRYFVLVDGNNVKKKVLALKCERVPAIFETRARKVCAEPARSAADGTSIPAVYKDELYHVCVKPESVGFFGQSDTIHVANGNTIRIGNETYSASRTPDGLEKALPRPNRLQE